jgi:4-carboxymuconolactone decarboxylase
MTERTYSERHATALDVMATMLAREDTDRVSSAMVARSGALGSFAHNVVMGDLWCRPQLSRRDRSLIVIAFLATQGAKEELDVHVKVGLNHGLTRVEIAEIIIQVAAYGGFPMAMAASRVMEAAFNSLDGTTRQPKGSPAANKDDATRRADAHEVLVTLSGGRVADTPEAAREAIVARLGGVGELAYDWAFGEVWSRTELSRRDRSLVVLAILGLLGMHDEFAVHVPGALRHGCTPEEVEEVMVQLVVYGGFPRAVEGMKAVRKALEKASA